MYAGPESELQILFELIEKGDGFDDNGDYVGNKPVTHKSVSTKTFNGFAEQLLLME